MWRKSIQKIHLPAPSVLSLIITRVEHTLDQYASLLWLICASSGPVRPTVTRRRVISFSTWQTGRVCFLPRSNFRHQSVREGFCLAERERRVLCCSVKESQWLLPQTDNERLPYWLPLLEKCNETWRCLNKHPELPPLPPKKAEFFYSRYNRNGSMWGCTRTVCSVSRNMFAQARVCFIHHKKRALWRDCACFN